MLIQVLSLQCLFLKIYVKNYIKLIIRHAQILNFVHILIYEFMEVQRVDNIFLLIVSILLRPFVILCGYMISSNSFPKPLTGEEEKKYLELYSQGDEEA